VNRNRGQTTFSDSTCLDLSLGSSLATPRPTFAAGVPWLIIQRGNNRSVRIRQMYASRWQQSRQILCEALRHRGRTSIDRVLRIRTARDAALSAAAS